MATITEDYISFECAKLLKEKGFKGTWCYLMYTEDGYTKVAPLVCDEGDYPKATIQMAMKWLREVHNIVIVIDVCRETGREGFYCWQLEDNHTGDNIVNIVGECSTYEQACEASILYCLKNLI